MSVGGTIGGKRGGEARKKQMAEEHGGEWRLVALCHGASFAVAAGQDVYSVVGMIGCSLSSTAVRR